MPHFWESSPVRRFWLSIFLVVLCGLGAWAQDEPEFMIETTTFNLKDNFERPYLVEQNTAWLSVRCVTGDEQTADLKGRDSLSASGIEYPLTEEEAEPLTFPIRDGQAQVQFVVFSDPGKNPVAYRIKLVEETEGSKRETPLNGGSWLAGNNTVEEVLQTNETAPRAQWEWGFLIGYPILAVILVYVWFGRSLFRRLLFNRNMQVGSALGTSNLLLILGWLTLAVVIPLLYFFPYVVWQQQYWIYLLVCGGHLLFVSLGFAAGLMVSKR